MYYIDKTKELEKGINVFPSIYIEGAAASGKTTAVKILKENHSEVIFYEFDMASKIMDLQKKMDGILLQMQEQTVWVIFENYERVISENISLLVCDFIKKLPESGRVIILSRECPNPVILDLFWKRQMEIISQEQICFTRNEIASMLEHNESDLNAESVYEFTGGWAGCVDVLIRIAKRTSMDIEQICETFEVVEYIDKYILGTLSDTERKVVKCMSVCPWVNEEILSEIWGISEGNELLKKLKRKGIINQKAHDNIWYLVKILRKRNMAELDCKWKTLGEWYEKHNAVKEALWCYHKIENLQEYHACLIRYYTEIPFSNLSNEEIMSLKQDCPQSIYLRGMYCYEHQNMDGFYKELELIDPAKSEERELYLNMMYVNPKITLKEWMELLKEHEKVTLYQILGNSCTFLCGIRDWSMMFACSKKEENQYAKFWKEHFGENEWKAYCLARIDYYIETKREDAVKEEWKQVYEIAQKRGMKYQFRIVAFYLLCKWNSVHFDEKVIDKIVLLEKTFSREENEACKRNANAIHSIYASWEEESGEVIRWTKNREKIEQDYIGEKNYLELICLAKSYLILRKYEKAEKILQKLVIYLQNTKKERFYIECLFQLALVNWGKNRQGQMLKYCIETFVLVNSKRYVGLFTRYGKIGYEVLNAYVEWMKNNNLEGWNRKKKYNYGNVLRMPVEEYVDFVLRSAKRETHTYEGLMNMRMEEYLTMTEIIILQAIGRGLSNAEICKEQNMKLPTVKSHIYNIYRKLGVSNRVQAMNKGKELEIIKTS